MRYSFSGYKVKGVITMDGWRLEMEETRDTWVKIAIETGILFACCAYIVISAEPSNYNFENRIIKKYEMTQDIVDNEKISLGTFSTFLTSNKLESEASPLIGVNS